MEQLMDRDEYMRDVVPNLKFDPIATDAAEFLGVSVDDVRALASRDGHEGLMRSEWRLNPPGLRERAVRKFYMSSKYGYVVSQAFADRRHYMKYSRIKNHLIGRTVLDYGSGTGTLSMLLHQIEKMDVTAADLDSAHFRFSQFRFQKNRMNIRCVTIPEQGYPVGRWDTIVCYDVLEHVVDWEGTLCWMRDSLESGGKIILQVSFDLYEDHALHISNATDLTRSRLMEFCREHFDHVQQIDTDLFVLTGENERLSA